MLFWELVPKSQGGVVNGSSPHVTMVPLIGQKMPPVVWLVGAVGAVNSAPVDRRWLMGAKAVFVSRSELKYSSDARERQFKSAALPRVPAQPPGLPRFASVTLPR